MMLRYEFMRLALVAGLALAVVVPCIGMIAVLKRLSMIGDALSHTSLAGVAGGLLFGVHPVLGAMAACVLAALGIEAVRRRIPAYSELSIAIILSAGVGLAGLLSGFLESSTAFNSYLFGSILSITSFETWVMVISALVVLLAFLLFYKELFLVTFDERGARLAGVPVAAINLLYLILTAVTIAAAARIVGTLIVSSLMVIPVTCAMQFARSFRGTVVQSVGFGVFFVLVGLTISFYGGTRPGATIVLVGIATLLILFVVQALLGRMRKGGVHHA